MRDEKIEIRCTPEEKALYHEAAKFHALDLSAFVRMVLAPAIANVRQQESLLNPPISRDFPDQTT